jgi:hypothetical protein
MCLWGNCSPLCACLFNSCAYHFNITPLPSSVPPLSPALLSPLPSYCHHLAYVTRSSQFENTASDPLFPLQSYSELSHRVSTYVTSCFFTSSRSRITQSQCPPSRWLLPAQTGGMCQLYVSDRGFLNTAAIQSQIMYIGGDTGVLCYHGYPIEQLV